MRWKLLWCERGRLLYTVGIVVAQVGKLWCQGGKGGTYWGNPCGAKGENCGAQVGFLYCDAQENSFS